MSANSFKYYISIILLTLCDMTIAEECVPPTPQSCALYNPKSIYFSLRVHFSGKKPKAIVYIDGGCSLGTTKLTPINDFLDNYLNSDTTLEMIYCIGHTLIDRDTLKITSDSKIECTASEELTCKKQEDE